MVFTLKKHFSNLCIFSCYIEMLHIPQKETFLPSEFHQKKTELHTSLLAQTILSSIKMFTVEGKMSRIITVYYIIQGLVVVCGINLWVLHNVKIKTDPSSLHVTRSQLMSKFLAILSGFIYLKIHIATFKR